MLHRFLCLSLTHACLIFNWCAWIHTHIGPQIFFIFLPQKFLVKDLPLKHAFRKIAVVWKRNLLLRETAMIPFQLQLWNLLVTKNFLTSGVFKLCPLPLEQFPMKEICFKITDFFVYKIAEFIYIDLFRNKIKF